jgi:hypothetical protein
MHTILNQFFELALGAVHLKTNTFRRSSRNSFTASTIFKPSAGFGYKLCVPEKHSPQRLQARTPQETFAKSSDFSHATGQIIDHLER